MCHVDGQLCAIKNGIKLWQEIALGEVGREGCDSEWRSPSRCGPILGKFV